MPRHASIRYINILSPSQTYTHASNNAAVIIGVFLGTMENTNAADSKPDKILGNDTDGLWGEQNPWAEHFVHAGPLSAHLSLGGCHVVALSLSQTTTTTCLC